MAVSITKVGEALKVDLGATDVKYYPLDDITHSVNIDRLELFERGEHLHSFKLADITTPTGADLEEIADKIAVVMAPAQGTEAEVTTLTTSQTDQVIKAANQSRKELIIVNDNTATLYIKYGGVASAADYTIMLLGDESAVIDSYTGVIHGISGSGPGGNILVTEIT